MTPPVCPAGAQGGTLYARPGAALSFVSCIALFDCFTRKSSVVATPCPAAQPAAIVAQRQAGGQGCPEVPGWSESQLGPPPLCGTAPRDRTTDMGLTQGDPTGALATLR